jgi:hypothetical protein
MRVLTISKTLAVAAIVTSSLLVSQPQRADAATFIESGDAGQTIPTAQNLGAGITIIQGNISSGSDADLFSFGWNGGNFSATTIGGANFDTILSIFNSAGTILVQNDDSLGTLQSTVNLANLAQGQYFLGMSSFSNFAQNGPIFPGIGGSSGAYSVTFNAPVAAAVPTPALLPGLVGLGLGAMRKRKQKAAAQKAVA